MIYINQKIIVKKIGINRNKWYKKEWQQYEEERKKIVNPLLKLKNNIEKEKSAENISEEIYKYLIDNNIFEKLNKKINILINMGENEVAEEYKNSLNLLIDVLDEIATFFKDEKLSIDKYKEILKIQIGVEVIK